MATPRKIPHLSRYYLEGDEFVEFARTMKSWADAGYWRTDVLNYSGAQDALMKEGTSGARQHHTETWTGFRTDAESQPGSDGSSSSVRKWTTWYL